MMFKLQTARAMIEALKQLLELEKEEAAARKEKYERKIEKLYKRLKESKGVVEVKKKERARLKEESVSRGHKIAAM